MYLTEDVNWYVLTALHVLYSFLSDCCILQSMLGAAGTDAAPVYYHHYSSDFVNCSMS